MVRFLPLVLLVAGCSSDVGDDLALPPPALDLAAPTGLTATHLGGDQVRLEWTDNATGETEYRVDMSETPFANVADVMNYDLAPADATLLVVTTDYFPTTYFRVIAVKDEALQSGYSNQASVTILLPPGAPGGLDAVLASPNEISLSWWDVSDETSYRLERSTDGGGVWTTLTVLPADSTSHLDSALDPGTEYSYRLFAVNGQGDSPPSDVVSCITPSDVMDLSTVCSADSPGWYSSMAVDAAGNEHISHHGMIPTDCLYTTHAGGSFATVTADSGPAFNSVIGNGGTSIAVDASGIVHIAAYDTSNGDLRYAENSSGTFVAVTIDTVGDVGGSPKLRIHPVDGSIHILYKADSTLRLAVFDGLAWSFETVTPVEPIGSFSFTLDTTGNPHVAYELRTDPSFPDLVHASRPGGTWTYEIVPLAFGRPSDNAIAVDASGAAHIIFRRDFVGSYTLQHATNAGGAWSVGPVDEPSGGSNLGYHNSLVIDPVSGRLHAAYYDLANGDLRYARKDPGGAWIPRVIDTEGNVGTYTGIAVDASGIVHISYRDETNDSLKRASGSP